MSGGREEELGKRGNKYTTLTSGLERKRKAGHLGRHDHGEGETDEALPIKAHPRFNADFSQQSLTSSIDSPFRQKHTQTFSTSLSEVISAVQLLSRALV